MPPVQAVAAPVNNGGGNVVNNLRQRANGIARVPAAAAPVNQREDGIPPAPAMAAPHSNDGIQPRSRTAHAAAAATAARFQKIAGAIAAKDQFWRASGRTATSLPVTRTARIASTSQARNAALAQTQQQPIQQPAQQPIQRPIQQADWTQVDVTGAPDLRLDRKPLRIDEVLLGKGPSHIFNSKVEEMRQSFLDHVCAERPYDILNLLLVNSAWYNIFNRYISTFIMEGKAAGKYGHRQLDKPDWIQPEDGSETENVPGVFALWDRSDTTLAAPILELNGVSPKGVVRKLHTAKFAGNMAVQASRFENVNLLILNNVHELTRADVLEITQYMPNLDGIVVADSALFTLKEILRLKGDVNGQTCSKYDPKAKPESHSVTGGYVSKKRSKAVKVDILGNVFEIPDCDEFRVHTLTSSNDYVFKNAILAQLTGMIFYWRYHSRSELNSFLDAQQNPFLARLDAWASDQNVFPKCVSLSAALSTWARALPDQLTPDAIDEDEIDNDSTPTDELMACYSDPNRAIVREATRALDYAITGIDRPGIPPVACSSCEQDIVFHPRECYQKNQRKQSIAFCNEAKRDDALTTYLQNLPEGADVSAYLGHNFRSANDDRLMMQDRGGRVVVWPLHDEEDDFRRALDLQYYRQRAPYESQLQGGRCVRSRSLHRRDDRAPLSEITERSKSVGARFRTEFNRALYSGLHSAPAQPARDPFALVPIVHGRLDPYVGNFHVFGGTAVGQQQNVNQRESVKYYLDRGMIVCSCMAFGEPSCSSTKEKADVLVCRDNNCRGGCGNAHDPPCEFWFEGSGKLECDPLECPNAGCHPAWKVVFDRYGEHVMGAGFQG